MPNTLIIEKIAKEKNNTFAENIYAMILFFHIFELPHPTDVDATEKVFILHKAVQYKVFLFVLIYYIMCIKIVFQWRPDVGWGFLLYLG